MVDDGVQSSVEWSCSCLNPTTHLHTLTTLYHYITSLASVPLAAVLSTPHFVVKMAHVAGSGDRQGDENK